MDGWARAPTRTSRQIRSEASRSSHRGRFYVQNGVKYSGEQCFTLSFAKFIGVTGPDGTRQLRPCARSEGGARFVALDLDSAHFEVASGKRRRTCRRVPTANASVRPAWNCGMDEHESDSAGLDAEANGFRGVRAYQPSSIAWQTRPGKDW